MRTIKQGLVLLLCAALLCAALGCAQKDSASVDPNAAVLTVGDVAVPAVAYRYQLNARYEAIQKSKLYDRDTYLAYIVNPTAYYPYPYRDTRTEEGMEALCADVLEALGLEAASIHAAKQAGYQLTIEDQYYIDSAEQDAHNTLDELAEDYGTIDAFYRATGFTEESFVHMYRQSREASIDFNKLLADYQKTHTLDEQAIEDGYARIVRETFRDRYKDGMYSQYLAYYIAGTRTFPSLYIPDDAIFVRLFAATEPTEAQKQAYAELAATDFGALYTGSDNEFTVQGVVGDLAIAPKDSLVDGLYAAAKDVAIGEVGTLTAQTNGKETFYLFLRVDGETGIVPIDRYPGMRERIVGQILGAQCMDTLRALLDDPAIAVQNRTLLDAIKPNPTGAEQKA